MFWGGRSYHAIDPEGHRWEFLQIGRELAPEHWSLPVESPVMGKTPSKVKVQFSLYFFDSYFRVENGEGRDLQCTRVV